MKVKLSTTSYSTMDSQTEYTIKTLEDMLSECVIDFKDNLDHRLHSIEFSYNNSYHSTNSIAPIDALYGRRCRSPLGWYEVDEFYLLGPALFNEEIEKVIIICYRVKTPQTRRKSYADNR